MTSQMLADDFVDWLRRGRAVGGAIVAGKPRRLLRVFRLILIEDDFWRCRRMIFDWRPIRTDNVPREERSRK